MKNHKVLCTGNHKELGKNNDLYVLIACAIGIIIASFITSCTTLQDVQKFIIDHPETTAKICPENDTIIKVFRTSHIDTLIKVQESDNGNDELIEMIYADSLLTLKEKLLKLKQIKPCKDKIISETIFKTDSVIIIDQNRINTAFNNGFEKGKKEQAEKNHSWIWILTTCLLSALLLLLLIGWFKRS